MISTFWKSPSLLSSRVFIVVIKLTSIATDAEYDGDYDDKTAEDDDAGYTLTL